MFKMIRKYPKSRIDKPSETVQNGPKIGPKFVDLINPLLYFPGHLKYKLTALNDQTSLDDVFTFKVGVSSDSSAVTTMEVKSLYLQGIPCEMGC